MGSNITTPYHGSGFRLDGPIESGDVIYQAQKAVKITKGDVIFNNAGYATNVGTAFAATFLGVAGADSDNSAGADGAVSVMIIKPSMKNYFWVPVGSAVAVTQAAVGTVVDLKTNHSVDITDTTLVSFGFEIADFDTGTLAVAANAAGYVKGKFMPQPQ